MYAFDTTERAAIARRSREWTAVGQTEAECVREMARCLREIGEWRVPRWGNGELHYLGSSVMERFGTQPTHIL